MSVPAYLMGSQTGGILSQQPPPNFSQTTPYFGGNQAPSNPISSYMTPQGGIDYPRMQRELGLSNTQMDQYIATAGKGEPWLTPDELRAKTNALQSNLWSGGGSGGGGGGASGQVGGASGQVGGGGAASGQVADGLLNVGATGGVQTGSGSPSGINQFPTISGTNPSGYNPGTGGINPGTGPSQGQAGGGIPGSQISGGQPLPMMQMGAQNSLNNYYNTAGYQLTNGQGAVNQFQQSPGYQFAVDQALGQVQRQGASRGLLDSGAGLRAMTDRAQGMANQEFNNWQTNQQNQYSQYQNRLQGLSSGPTGADQAFALGQGVGNNAMQNGSNIGSLLANQGNSLFGGIVGAGGAQAQNVNQAGNMQAQILSGNLQTQMMLAALAAGQQGAR